MQISLIEDWIDAFKKEGLWLSGEAHGEVKSVTSDTRACGLGKLGLVFFARKGVQRDGHDFLKELCENNDLLALFVEKIPEDLHFKCPLIQVRDTTYAMALASKKLFGDPTDRTFCVAVTGTNGKTTTTYLTQSLLNTAGYRTAVSGTVKTIFENREWPSTLTTPDFVELQKCFAELKAEGANAFAFEASSHAIDQRRLLGVELNAAIFTNLSPEHLDYHATMAAYYEAKKNLFKTFLTKSSKENRYAILPLDGSYGSQLYQELKGEPELDIRTWGFYEKTKQGDLSVLSYSTDLSGSQMLVGHHQWGEYEFRTPLVGRFNIENLMGVITLGAAMEIDPDRIQLALSKVEKIPGRLERVESSPLGQVFVDYAHTPDALENILMTLRPLTKGRLKVVFGCGGDRDKSKRPQMGAIAELHADELIITSDNPRTEAPEKIIQEIQEGLQKLKKTTILVDRKSAIEHSLQDLKPEDVVVIAGKGHEDYQIIGNERISFDDREVVRLALS